MKYSGIMSLIALFLVGGCTSGFLHSDVTGIAEDAPMVVTPPDGSADVSVNTDVTLTFAQPVDSQIVRRGFHLIAISSVTDSCTVNEDMNHGSMATAMLDRSMMDHLDEYHTVSHSLTWGADFKVVWVRPIHPLESDEDYMIHLDTEMTSMVESMMPGMIGMDPMSGMADHGFNITPAGLVVHFRTGGVE